MAVIQLVRYPASLVFACVATLAAVSLTPVAAADNKRLNDSVVANVFTVQRQAGCETDYYSFGIDPRLQLAAQWQVDDLMGNGALGGDTGSDGSTPVSRAVAAGFSGDVAETVAINPALAVNNIDVTRMWFDDPHDLAIMRDCRYLKMGVSQ